MLTWFGERVARTTVGRLDATAVFDGSLLLFH